MKVFQDVLRRLDQLGALADERVAAPGLWGVDRTGDGKHLAALFGGHPGGDERARLQRRLHHQGALRQTGNDAVALREVGRQRGRAQREFADQGAALGDPVG